jgi:glycosyltransferase involved in cell wall biosynthesis
MKGPLVSAVVCTYNRAESLRDTLNSLKRQTLGPGLRLELVVVDNNSRDQTKDVVTESAYGTPYPIQYVVESRQGIAYARNRGLQAARGAYVAYVDDDAVAAPAWIDALVRCFEETGADLVGGKIEPLWLTPRPRWLVDDLMGPITAFDLGATRKRCASRREAFLTTNCALRAASAKRYGLFDVSLGRRGSRWVGGEDFDLFHRWLAQGASIFYEPGAVVQHKVSPERVTPAFYHRWFEDVGYTQGHQLDWKWHYRASVLPAWRWTKLLKAGIHYAAAKTIPVDEAKRLRAELWWKFERSFAKERLDHWRNRMPCRFAKA